MSSIKDSPALDDSAYPARGTHHVTLATAAIEEEKRLGFKAVFRLYYKAAIWSALLSTALVMEGYDIGIINSFFGHPAFQRTFGSTTADGTLYIPANWQSAINNAATIGQVIGLTVNGWAQARYGARPVYVIGMLMMIGTIFIPVFSTSLPMLFAGELLCGIPWGVFQTLTTAYASEICPVAMRGYLASYVNMCWGMGLFLAAGVVRASLLIESNWAWKMPFMLQWVWPVPLLFVGYSAPESPWHLIRRGRLDDARKSLRRLARDGHYTEDRLDQEIAFMVHTNELEKEEMKGAGYRECFRGTNLRRTEISAMVWIIQIVCGQPICGYATQFLQTAGMPVIASFDLQLSINSMYIIGTLSSWYFMSKAGRRTIYLTGSVVLGSLCAIIGILGFFVDSNPNAAYGVGSLMILIQYGFNVTLGPGTYAIIAEIPATRVRAHTIVIGRTCYLLMSLVTNQLVPRMLTPDGFNWGARCGLFWAGINVLSFLYSWFRLPESKGRTYEELDKMFFGRVPARKFKTTVFDSAEDGPTEVALPDDVDEKDRVEHVETPQRQ